MKARRGYRVRRFGIISKILYFFVDSPLTPLLIIGSLLLGTLAVYLLPREEEPQIVVPVIDVFVQMPGSTAKEVEQRVTRPLEKLAWELPGVEYIYSTASPGQSLTIVRFLVGRDEEESIVQLYQKLYANLDRIPSGASRPILKPRRIDDVPVLALTLHGGGYDFQALRNIATAVDDAVKQVPDVSETTLIGGQRRQVRVELDAALLSAYQIDPTHVLRILRAANQQNRAGSFPQGDTETLIETGGFLRDRRDVEMVVVGMYMGQLVYLRDIATVIDGPQEPVDYVLFGRGADVAGAEAHGAGTASATAGSNNPGTTGTDGPGAAGTDREEPAVTLTVAKRKGTNAVRVVAEVMHKVELLRGNVIPPGMEVTVTRDYGHTATEKSDELLFHMGLAAAGVTLLVAVVLGWRESMVVAIAIPVTLALTLATFYLLGFTLNRVTLFALIFSIGILVDDPIVDVENVVRHFRLPENRGRPLKEVTVEAVNEVRSPLILATLTVIAAVLPMAFVQGLMGPYMRPIPIGATAAMLFSMAVAFVVTPWAAYRMLRWHARHGGQSAEREDWTTRLYRRVMGPMIHRPILGMGFLAGITLLLLAACSMVVTGAVKVKMLPFDNKSELQVIIDMDEGTTLERTLRVAQDIAVEVRKEPELLNYQIYAGTAAPYNFNGLVRHYFLRSGPNVADIQVNFVPKDERERQSHEIAKSIRARITPLAERLGARVKVAEVPPGPPVLQTIVTEIYGPDYAEQIRIAEHIQHLLEATPGVVDVDSYVEADQPRLILRFDQEKAALHGIGAAQVAQLVQIAEAGASAGLLHAPAEREDVPILVRLALRQRADPFMMLPMPLCPSPAAAPVESVRGFDGSGSRCVPLGEVVRIERGVGEKSIYRKNMLPVVYVTADVAGAEESPVYAILQLNHKIHEYIPEGRDAPLEIWNIRQPFSTDLPSMKWDGEWHITYEVFRDLGAAFAVVLVLIYTLVVGWFRSFRTPLIIMAAIPFSLIGILPAHWATGAFFTATSMIGFMAGAGIVVRNSIILVDFIKLRVKQGMDLPEAVIDAGAVRFRPMMLTAMAVVVGGSVILFDPIFQGLAISLMAGEVASLLISRLAVPVIYFLWMRHYHKDITARAEEVGRAPGVGAHGAAV
ncbi:MAG: efflux RND transporter permease subunit [Thiohalocapsa sp.]|uniref:efflux RND transporter permease subunit n=1 Tax=Thiohalocapsa sp. TaxID=2497641 RepID=UPI0025E0E243|nr:efflux RND transporter permease subunit [Thiohalocapsa sp.]MCG6940452.1 efflux RND transporter permease subunit [Thiohalocapsa sp.]